MENTTNCQITTAILGSPRDTEECFETPNGSAITIDHDLLNNERPSTPTAGPLQMLRCGENTVALGHFGCSKTA